MAQYEAIILRLEITHGAAINRLVAMSDDDLISRLPQWMLEDHPRLTPRSWRPDEPEHEALATELRAQARADLLTAYFGDGDYCADERLAYARTRPHPTLIYLADFEPDDDEPDECGSTNPVVRLRALDITTAPPAETTPEPIVRLEASQDRLDAIHNRIIHGPITATTITPSNYRWATSTASDGWNGSADIARRTATPITGEDLRMAWADTPVTAETLSSDREWVNASADIARYAAVYRDISGLPAPRMSDLDVVEEEAVAWLSANADRDARGVLHAPLHGDHCDCRDCDVHEPGDMEF